MDDMTEILKQKLQQTEKVLVGVEQQLCTVEEELKLIELNNYEKQMQPHFLYNALLSIGEMIFINQGKAAELLDFFIFHLQSTIKSLINQKRIPLWEELEHIKAYVEICKMGNEERFHVDYKINANDFLILPLSVQMLVENAIQHGLYQKETENGTVIITTEETEMEYLIIVEDNGIGFDFDKTMEEISAGKRDSYGLQNLIYRYEHEMGADVSVDSQYGAGTTVTVRIPRKTEKIYSV